MRVKSNLPVSINVVIPGDIISDRLITDSTVFPMRYEFREGMLIMYTKENGVLAVPIRSMYKWLEELSNITDVWEDVRT